jgi:hypothetical protein
MLQWTGGPMRPLYPVPARFDEFVPLFQPQRTYDAGRKRRVLDGFSFSADARLEDKRFIVLRISAGKHVDCNEQLPWPNSVSIATVIHDPHDADYPILEAFRPALAAVINAWRSDRAGAFSRDPAAGMHDPAHPSFYNGAWVAYLAPHLSQTTNIPTGAATKPASDGGLLLWATDRIPSDPKRRHVCATTRETMPAASS